MDYIEALSRVNINSAWATIGAFDGVHTGHRILFNKLVDGARQDNCRAVAITFDPLPALFFERIKTGQVLTTLTERVSLIKSLGVDDVIVLDFNRALADVEAFPFMQQVHRTIGLKRLLSGFNSRIGKDQAGSVSRLKEIGQQLGFSVEIVPPIRNGQEIISSSNIRKLIKAGDISRAKQYLGRPYTVSGEVVHGDHRGSKLGIPTANLAIPGEQLLPATGVYACKAIVGERSYIAVTNVGVRPTFENPLSTPRIEPHLLDTDETFYGAVLKLEFYEYLRPEVRFPDAKALVAQIQQDIQKTRELFADAP